MSGSWVAIPSSAGRRSRTVLSFWSFSTFPWPSFPQSISDSRQCWRR